VKRRSAPAALGAVVLLAALGAGATGCSGPEEASPGTAAGPGPTTTTGPVATTGPAVTTTAAGAGEAAVLTEGRHPVFIVAADAAKRTMVVDEVQFLTGTAATKAAAEDGKESPPPNDYYIRNQNPRKRTVPVAPNASITVNTLKAEETGSATKNVPLKLAELASYFPNPDHPLFWVTVRGGQAQRIEQQFLP